jgi:putative ABC transport system ATP-binding protein
VTRIVRKVLGSSQDMNTISKPAATDSTSHATGNSSGNLTGGQENDVVIEVIDLVKTYGEGESAVHALAGVSLVIERGDFVTIMGSSGSGKSTLMNILGCLDVPTSGTYKLDGVDSASMNESQLADLRNAKIGFIFQSFNLLRRTSAVRNVEVPLAYAGVGRRERRKRALAALASVGLAERGDHQPNELSGGQMQRVAVARALVTDPAIVMADEATGNLDSKSTADVIALLEDLNAAGRTIVWITHEEEVAMHSKRRIMLVDGKILTDERVAAVHEDPPLMAQRSLPTAGAPQHKTVA